MGRGLMFTGVNLQFTRGSLEDVQKPTVCTDLGVD